MLQLKNHTPFKAAIAVFPNERGIDSLYVAVKATFTLGRSLEPADEQIPVRMADEYWGEPGQSSLKYASELHLSKPSTDIVMIGRAWPPGGKAVTRLDVQLQAARQRKTVRVFGERRWFKAGNELRITEPIPFESMPLRYERAYGGLHAKDPEGRQVLCEPRNPVGAGFRGDRRPEELHGLPLPNLEDPAHPIARPDDRPPPACFGYVAAAWEPRKSFAGTYDETWAKKRAPYLPQDFDSRYFNAAHPDLVCQAYLKGGEPVTMTHLSPAGPLAFNLPLCEFDISVQVAGRMEHPPLNLETVLIEPEENRLGLLWRAAVECDKMVLKVSQVDIVLKDLTADGARI